MTTDLATLVNKAATGDPGAFADLLVALHHDLRAWMAGFATHKAMVDTAEREVWAHVRRELLASVPTVPMTVFMHQTAAVVLSRMLQTVQNASHHGADPLQYVMTTDGLLRQQQAKVLSNDVAKNILTRFRQLSDEDQSLLQDIHVHQKPLHELSEIQKQPLTVLATRCFDIRRRLFNQEFKINDEDIESSLALLVCCHLDRSIIPTDLAVLQNRIKTAPVDAAAVVQQVRVFNILSELLDPQAHATIRILASELVQGGRPRARTDTSMVRAVNRASVRAKRIPFTDLPPPPPPPTTTTLWPAFIVAGALVLVGIIALSLVWGQPHKKITDPLLPVPIPDALPVNTKATSSNIAQTPLTVANNDRYLRGINIGGEGLLINKPLFIGQTEAEQLGFKVNVKSIENLPGSVKAIGLDFDTKGLLESGITYTKHPIEI